jgi:hypothetical protein
MLRSGFSISEVIVARREARFKHVHYPTDAFPRVRFRIPEGWVEDYADPEVGLFYDPPDHGGGPWPIGGMLFAFAGSKKVDIDWTPDSFEQYVRTRFSAATPRRLADGTWLTYSEEFKQDKSHHAVVHNWNRLVARAREVRVFGWSFTGVAEFYGKPGDCYFGVVEMLIREIEAAELQVNAANRAFVCESHRLKSSSGEGVTR